MTNGLIWIFINLVLPVAAPIVGMWLEQLAASNIRDACRREAALRTRRVIMLFKDGQLGWVGLVMCFAAMSDLIDGVRKYGFPESVSIGLFVSAGLACANGFFATKGAAENSDALDEFSWVSFRSDYPAAYGTMLFTFSAAVTFGLIHFWAK
ncbi:MAG TPA: hypothetical protein VL424_16525 [Pararobbsia sp.]|jgi:hypothetical protein|nr:hypothetical protein [Pararobbsia sp.]